MKLDFAKVGVWTCLGLSLIGAGSYFYLRDWREKLEEDKKKALNLLHAVHQARLDVDVLQAEKDQDEGLRLGQDRIAEYFADRAKDAKLPGPSMARPKDETPGRAKGYKDTLYELNWNFDPKTNTGFDRQNIAAFLWYIENKTSLLKISQLRLETDEKTRSDRWKARVYVTERRPSAGGTTEGGT